MKPIRFVALALMTVVLVSGCGTNPLTPEEKVRSALNTTEVRPRGFVYRDQGVERDAVVQGALEDDYRYKARLLIDGVDAADEVAVDDALAMRFTSPTALDDFLSRSRNLAAPGTPVVEVLRSARWVLDPSGAPELTAPALQSRAIGDDPVLDALTAFVYVQRAMREAESVDRFNPEAVDYVAAEDRFPKPKEGSAVVRYDVKPPQIPPFTGTLGGSLPDTRHFRRMSIYVKEGTVLQVMEDVDLGTRYDRLVEALDLKIPSGLSRGERLAFAVDALNGLRATRRTEPVRLRRMSLEIIDLGKAVSVQMPGDSVNGNLSVIPNRGRSANVTRQAAP
jgi:hypothetical protein